MVGITFTGAEAAKMRATTNRWARGMFWALWANVAFDVVVLGGLIWWKVSVAYLIPTATVLIVTSLGYLLVAIYKAISGSILVVGISLERLGPHNAASV